MNIQQLVAEAKETSPEFKQKYNYWTVQRKKAPTLDWLMPKLEEALGRSYVRQAAKDYIESQKEKASLKLTK